MTETAKLVRVVRWLVVAGVAIGVFYVFMENIGQHFIN